MKKIIGFLVYLIILNLNFDLSAQKVIVTDKANYNTAAAGALLDINSDNAGLLPPRIALTSSTDVNTISARTNGLLVYNTNSMNDVFPGYYYWSGSSWTRMSGATDPNQNLIVAKDEDATLLKTENLVFASVKTNDADKKITLTLPTITAADNGLEITVKHVGLHTDLINVAPASGQYIDGYQTPRNLMRWEGKTFVAVNSRWVQKDKSRDDSNVLIVHPTGSFTTIKEAIEFLNEHMHEFGVNMVVRLCCGIHSISETITINLPHAVTIEGLSFGTSEINISAALGFDVQTEAYFKQVTMTGAEKTAIKLSGSDEYYEIKDAYFHNLGKAVTITNSVELWFFEVDVTDITTTGIEIAATSSKNVFVKVSESDFKNNAISINLLSAGSESVIDLKNGVYYNSTAGQTAVNYNPSTFLFKSVVVASNTFNLTGNFVSGTDFSRNDGRDANFYLENNVGVSTQKAHVKVNVRGNTRSTATTAGVWTPVFISGSALTSSRTKFSVVNDTVAYLSNNVVDLVHYLSGTVQVSTSGGTTVSIAISHNNSVLDADLHGMTDVYIKTSGEPFNFSTVGLVSDVVKNDFFQIYVKTNNGATVTLGSLNWFVDSH